MTGIENGRISPRVDMRYWDLEKLAEQERVLVRLEENDNWESARVRIHQLCAGLGWRVATRETANGWQVYRVGFQGAAPPERALKAPYDQMDRLQEEPCVLLECGQDGKPPGKLTAMGRVHQIAIKRGWVIAARRVPRGIRVYRLDHPGAVEPPGRAEQTHWIDPGCLRFGEPLRLILAEPDDMAHAKREVEEWCREQELAIRFVDIHPDVVDVLNVSGKKEPRGYKV